MSLLSMRTMCIHTIHPIRLYAPSQAGLGGLSNANVLPNGKYHAIFGRPLQARLTFVDVPAPVGHWITGPLDPTLRSERMQKMSKNVTVVTVDAEISRLGNDRKRERESRPWCRHRYQALNCKKESGRHSRHTLSLPLTARGPHAPS